MKVLLPFLLLPVLFLGACNTTGNRVTVISEQLRVVKPPEEWYARCRTLNPQDFPDISRLSDKQVANIILKLYRQNVTCKQALEAVREYLDSAEVQLAKN